MSGPHRLAGDRLAQLRAASARWRRDRRRTDAQVLANGAAELIAEIDHLTQAAVPVDLDLIRAHIRDAVNSINLLDESDLDFVADDAVARVQGCLEAMALATAPPPITEGTTT